MRRFLKIFILSFSFFFLSWPLLACQQEKTPVPASPKRIVSLSPAITETLAALDQEQNIVGITSYCNWPPEIRGKAKVGGYMQINPEALLLLKPDLVVLPAEMAHFKETLENIQIPSVIFDSSSLSKFLDSAQKLGQICNVSQKAEKLRNEFQVAINHYHPAKNNPSILFILANQENCGKKLDEPNIIGNDDFYNELIMAAGGKNAYQGKLSYPRISAEAVIAMNPDIIVIAGPECPKGSSPCQEWRQSWPQLRKTPIHILSGQGYTIPGPRAFMTLQRLKDAVESYGK